MSIYSYFVFVFVVGMRDMQSWKYTRAHLKKGRACIVEAMDKVPMDDLIQTMQRKVHPRKPPKEYIFGSKFKFKDIVVDHGVFDSSIVSMPDMLQVCGFVNRYLRGSQNETQSIEDFVTFYHDGMISVWRLHAYCSVDTNEIHAEL